MLDPDVCYRALETRDPRFDGRLFVGVSSTGIYCRPVCPARTPLFRNCRFFPSAAAAQEAGFRPCLRCRPETAPDHGSWRGTSNTVSRALALIGEGCLDGSDAGVDLLAERLGVGGRQLRRLFERHLGASPVAVAQTRRVLFAKQLIQETRMPMTEVALAAGFGSVRRFNETFHELFQRPPSALRRKATTSLPEGSASDAGVTLRLRYRPPYAWDAMLACLGDRAIPGVEGVAGEVYCRAVSIDGQVGTVEVGHEPSRQRLRVLVRIANVRSLPAILGRVRRRFDIGADIEAIGAHLARDPLLAPLVASQPGLRAPGGWDGFEVAVRAVLDEGVGAIVARRRGEALARLCGQPLPRPVAHLTHTFPTPERLSDADLGVLDLEAPRSAALRALALAAIAEPTLLAPFGTVEEAAARFSKLPGLDERIARSIALQIRGETDAFVETDLGVLRRATERELEDAPVVDLLRRAEPWRPWRAYAVQHLRASVGA